MTEFVLTPPSGAGVISVVITTLMIGTVLGMLGATIASFIAKKREWILTAVVLVFMVPFAIWLIGLIKPSPDVITFTDTSLSVKIGSYADLTLTKADIRSATVIADMQNDGQNKPVMRTNGSAIAEYRKGWFRLASGEKALLLTKGTRVVRLELADKVLLLAPDDVSGFIDRLSRLVPVASPTGP